MRSGWVAGAALLAVGAMLGRFSAQRSLATSSDKGRAALLAELANTRLRLRRAESEAYSARAEARRSRHAAVSVAAPAQPQPPPAAPAAAVPPPHASGGPPIPRIGALGTRAQLEQAVAPYWLTPAPTPPATPLPAPPTTTGEKPRITATAHFVQGFPTDSTCPEMLGLQSLEKHRTPPVEVCSASTPPTPSESWLRCSNPGHMGLYFCEGANMRVMPGQYNLVDFHRKRWSVPDGAMRGLCSMRPGVPRPPKHHVAYEHEQRLLNAFRGGMEEGRGCADGDNVVEPLTVAVFRVDNYNPFHSHEDILGVWKTYVIRDLDPQRTAILFTDVWPDGPYLDLYRTAFAPVHGVMRMKDINTRPRPTCFRRLIFAIPAGNGIGFNIARNDARCRDSPLLRGYRKFMLASFGLPPDPRRAVPNVLVIARLTDPPDRQRLLRRMVNREQLLQGLQGVCKGGAACRVSAVDFPALHIRDQIQRASETDVLVGTHGAALTFCLFMPSHGTVVEFGTFADFHYANMARYAGLQHVMLRGPRHSAPSFLADVPQAVAAVRAAVARVPAMSGAPPTPAPAVPPPPPAPAPADAQPPGDGPVPPLNSSLAFLRGVPEPNCPTTLGLKNLERHRAGGTVEVCAAASPAQSWLRCANPGHSGLYLCEAANMRVMPKSYNLLRFTPKVWSVPKGAMRGHCRRNTRVIQPEYSIGYEHKNRLLNSFSASETAEDHRCQEGDTVVEAKTVAVFRVDNYNPFHSHEDILGTWKTFLLHDLNPRETAILFTDVWPDGPYLDLYRTAFAPVHGVMRMKEINTHPRPTCFRRLIFAVPAGDGIGFNINRNDMQCRGSSLLTGYRRFVLASFGLPRGPPALPQVLLVDRVTDPPDGRRLARRMSNREDLLAGLRGACKGGAVCQVVAVDFPALRIRDQVRQAAATSILVGSHGAALTFCLFMEPPGTVVEFGTGGDFHYANMARYVGLQHVMLRGPGHGSPSFTADVAGAVRAVRSAWAKLPAARGG